MINIVAKPYYGVNAQRCRLPFYLAIEEWAARHLPEAEYFFTWRVNPTVIIGRNQWTQKEVNLDYCRDHGIELYRRRSGGGCVYADNDNLMMSYITPSTEVTTTFGRYTGMVAEMLRSLNLNAEATGRNDVTIDGAKVSGNAFYHMRGRSIVHGTMLYDVDLETMSHAITPSRSKLESKGVKSVDSRVTSVSKYPTGLSLEAFEKYIIDWFTDKQYILTDSDLEKIHEIEQRYYDLKWTFGRHGLLGAPKDEHRINRRIDGVGEINAIIHLDGGKIDDIDMTGDFFVLSDLDSMLFDKIKGCELKQEPLAEALHGTDVRNIIAGLTTERFIELISTK